MAGSFKGEGVTSQIWIPLLELFGRGTYRWSWRPLGASRYFLKWKYLEKSISYKVLLVEDAIPEMMVDPTVAEESQDFPARSSNCIEKADCKKLRTLQWKAAAWEDADAASCMLERLPRSTLYPRFRAETHNLGQHMDREKLPISGRQARPIGRNHSC